MRGDGGIEGEGVGGVVAVEIAGDLGAEDAEVDPAEFELGRFAGVHTGGDGVGEIFEVASEFDGVGGDVVDRSGDGGAAAEESGPFAESEPDHFDPQDLIRFDAAADIEEFDRVPAVPVTPLVDFVFADQFDPFDLFAEDVGDATAEESRGGVVRIFAVIGDRHDGDAFFFEPGEFGFDAVTADGIDQVREGRHAPGLGDQSERGEPEHTESSACESDGVGMGSVNRGAAVSGRGWVVGKAHR